MILLKDDALLTTGIPVSCDKLALEIPQVQTCITLSMALLASPKAPTTVASCIAIKYQSSATAHKSQKHKHRVHLENITPCASYSTPL